MVACHILSCIWILLAFFNYDRETDEWLSDGNWIIANGLESETIPRIYLISLYFIIETMSTVGYGDYGPVGIAETIFLTIMFIFGVVAFSYATGSLTSMF